MGIFEKIFGADDKVDNKNNQEVNSEEKVEESYDDVFDSIVNDENRNDEKKNDNENSNENKEANKEVIPKEEDKKTNEPITVDIDGVPVTFEQDELKDILANSIKAKEKIDNLDIYAKIAEEFKNSNIEPTDLVAFKDALTGNKEALKYILKKYNEDDIAEMLDDDNVDYEPIVDYDTNDFDIKKEFERIVARDEQLAFKIKSNIDIMPDAWKSQLMNKDIFNAYKEDVEKGVFDIVYPNAYKEYIKNPNLSLVEAYSIAYEKLAKNYKEPEKKEPVDTSYSKNSAKSKNTYDEIFEQLLKE